jgi:uncharacterized membrane protein
MKLTLLLSFFFGCNLFCFGQSYTISSPDKNILVTCNAEKAVYTISYKGQSITQDSKAWYYKRG